MRKSTIAMLALLLLVAGFALAYGPDSCRYGHGPLYYTGQTRIAPNSTMEFLCKCGAGDKFWYPNTMCGS